MHRLTATLAFLIRLSPFYGSTGAAAVCLAGGRDVEGEVGGGLEAGGAGKDQGVGGGSGGSTV